MRIKGAVTYIIIINVLAFLLQLVVSGFTDVFVLLKGVSFFQPWRFLTSMFLHGSPSHLLFNMIGLYFFGQLLESRIGTKRFLGIYLGSGLLAGLVGALIYPAALGASGALMGVLGVLVILMPNIKVLIHFMFPMPLWGACILWVFLDTFGIFFPSGTANVAHLVGLATGLLYGYFLKGKKRKVHRKISGKTHLSSGDMEEYMNSGRI